jgi:hypothetical protein
MLGTCLEDRLLISRPVGARQVPPFDGRGGPAGLDPLQADIPGFSEDGAGHLHDRMHMELGGQLRHLRVSTSTKSRLAKGARFGTIPAACR